jgi:DNA polymerase-3 subunit delta
VKYDNRRAFEKHLENAAPHHFSQLYLILSQDPVEGKEVVQVLIRSILSNFDQIEGCVSTKEGARLTLSEILTEIHSPSFFVPKRILWIQNADKLKKEISEKLESHLSHLRSSMYVLLTASQLTKSTSFYKKIEKEGIILELQELKSWEKEKKLVEWISKQASIARKHLPHPLCQQLVKQSGLDQNLLQQEFEKLLCYIGDKKEITLQDIEAICTNDSISTIWQLGEALFRRDAAAAYRISQGLLQEGSALIPLLRQIRSQYQIGYHICTLLEQGGQAAQVAQDYPYLKGNLLERQMDLARGYGIERFKQGILLMDTTEMQTKNSQISEQLLMELLIFKLT